MKTNQDTNMVRIFVLLLCHGCHCISICQANTMQTSKHPFYTHSGTSQNYPSERWSESSRVFQLRSVVTQGLLSDCKTRSLLQQTTSTAWSQAPIFCQSSSIPEQLSSLDNSPACFEFWTGLLARDLYYKTVITLLGFCATSWHTGDPSYLLLRQPGFRSLVQRDKNFTQGQVYIGSLHIVMLC